MNTNEHQLFVSNYSATRTKSLLTLKASVLNYRLHPSPGTPPFLNHLILSGPLFLLFVSFRVFRGLEVQQLNFRSLEIHLPTKHPPSPEATPKAFASRRRGRHEKTPKFQKRRSADLRKRILVRRYLVIAGCSMALRRRASVDRRSASTQRGGYN